MRPIVHRGIVGSLALKVTVELIWILQGFTDISYPKKLVDTGIVTVKRGHIQGSECAHRGNQGDASHGDRPCCFAVSAVSRVTSTSQVLDKYLFDK